MTWVVSGLAILLALVGLRIYCGSLRVVLRERLWEMAVCPFCGYRLCGSTSHYRPECGSRAPSCTMAVEVDLADESTESDRDTGYDERRAGKIVAACTFLVSGVLCQWFACYHVRWSGSGSLPYPAIWGGFLFQSMLGWILSVLYFVLGFVVALAAKSAPAAQWVSRGFVASMVYLAGANTVLFGIVMIVGFAFL
ncbi:MAG: hypothetical protein HY718_03055 [Planctomycetes bacterium]|nr:hypothetical protein [Planctomycetota bacterium]